jgi:hypothetical protein
MHRQIWNERFDKLDAHLRDLRSGSGRRKGSGS